MSKSRGRTLSPLDLADKYGLDALRYFLLREMVFGLDANFSEVGLVARLNADLANNLGNLLQRTLAMVERFLQGKIPPAGEPATEADWRLRRAVEDLDERLSAAMASLQFHRALEAIWDCLDIANQYIDAQKPWELAKKNPAAVPRVLGHACEVLRLVGLYLYPFIPATAERMWAQLGLAGPLAGARLAEAGRWGAGEPRPLARGEPLFPRVEFSLEAVATEAPARSEAPAEVAIEEFRRLDLRVAEIREARAIPGSKKLVELKVAVGSEERTVVAGLRLDYPPAELVGKQVVIVANLKPVSLMGVQSRGMLLAVNEPDGRITLVAPERPVTPGAPVT